LSGSVVKAIERRWASSKITTHIFAAEFLGANATTSDKIEGFEVALAPASQ
jgi:hypothetical protein